MLNHVHSICFILYLVSVLYHPLSLLADLDNSPASWYVQPVMYCAAICRLFSLASVFPSNLKIGLVVPEASGEKNLKAGREGGLR